MAFSYNKYEESDLVKKRRQEAENNSKYQESQAVVDYRNQLNNHNQNRPQQWTGGTYGQSLQNAMDKITNREKFTYDLNGDALYQQYKDKYINQGKMAMMDTLGQAAQLTGGYGNSYAVTAGNQAYQGQLQNLNDIVPQLYQIAMDAYNREGDDLYKQYGLYNDAYNTEYGQYRDQVADWNTEANRLTDAYNNERNMDYTKFSNDRNYFTDAYNQERNYDYGLYSDSYSRDFANYQQNVAEQQFADKMAWDRDQFNQNMAWSKDQFAQQMALENAKFAETVRSNKADEAYKLASLNAKSGSGSGSKSGSGSQTSGSEFVRYSDEELMKMRKQYEKAVKDGSETNTVSHYDDIADEIKNMDKTVARDYIKEQWANGNLTTEEYSILMNKIRG